LILCVSNKKKAAGLIQPITQHSCIDIMDLIFIL
jgi:hypothetical protein